MDTAAFIFSVRNHEDESRMLLWHTVSTHQITTRHVR